MVAVLDSQVEWDPCKGDQHTLLCYRLLEQDDQGLTPEDKQCNLSKLSCFHEIALSQEKVSENEGGREGAKRERKGGKEEIGRAHV